MQTPRFLPIVSALLSFTVAPVIQGAEITSPRQKEPGNFSVTLGAEYNSGDYGGSAVTDIWTIPLTFRYDQNRWLFSVTLPYLSVQGPSDILIVGGSRRSMRTPGAGTTTVTKNRTDSGIGDIVAACSYGILPDADNRSSIDLTGKIYFGTADETRGLGTGENDYAVQLDATRSVGEASVFGTLGYRVTGNPPGVDYKDVSYGAIGIERDLANSTSGAANSTSGAANSTLGVAFDAHPAYLSGIDAYATLTGYLALRLEKREKITPYVLYGLSDTAPDWGVGVTYGWYY